MDIVDGQIHFGPGMIDTTLAAMDAIGVRAVLVDELWVTRTDVYPDPDRLEPGFALWNGAWRVVYPVAELAASLHPDRFGCIVRLDARDPGLEGFMRTAAAAPHVRAFRLIGSSTLERAEALKTGGYDGLCAIAQDLDVPLCMGIQGYAEYLAPYLARFPRLAFVLDHWGMGLPGLPPGRPQAEMDRARSPAYLDHVLALARYPNLAVKLSHAPFYFNAPDYPYDAVRPHLQRMIEAFGADRLIWSSDATMLPMHRWGDLLNWIRLDPDLSRDEKAWILGGTARRVFDWPA